MRTKLILLVCAAWLVASYPSLASGQEKRFVEIPSGGQIETFDLSTVQLITPGRFTVISTTIDDPDMMTFELRVLDTLRPFCARPSGKYPAPAAILAAGPPDMPVENIKVKSSQTKIVDKTYPYKIVTWSYPYKRLAIGREERPGFLQCKQYPKTEDQLYEEMHSIITNGLRNKTLYDCSRGLVGVFLNVNDDPSKAYGFFVKKNTLEEQNYIEVCGAVTHKMPYLPK
jgi:hypothetical protein